MKKYSGWQAVYMSFFSGEIYRDVAQNWGGVGYLYLLCVIAATWVLVSITTQIIVNTALDKYVEPVIAKWPTVTIKDGKLSIDKPTPYVIDIGDQGCIDFESSEDAKLPTGKAIGIVVTPTTVHQIDPDGTDKPVITLSQLGTSEMVFDQKTLQSIITGVKTWLGPGLFVIVTPIMMIFCMLQTLIYGVIGLIVANAMNIRLTFGQLVRLASVALTPALVLEAIVRATGHAIPFWGLIAMVIAIGYVIFGVRANSGTEQPLTTSI